MTTEDLWFRIIIIIALIAFLVLFIANAVYYNKLKNGNCTAVSNSQANMMFWLNLIWAIIVGIVLIWAIVRIFIRPKPSANAAARSLTTSQPVIIESAQPQPQLQQPQNFNIVPGPTQIIPQGQQPQFQQSQFQPQQFQSQFQQPVESSGGLAANVLPGDTQQYYNQAQNLF
jgi:hypothetical protein